MPRAYPNRWGYVFRKGQWVDAMRSDDLWTCYRFVRLRPWDDFSRAYGRQAVVLDEFDDDEHMVGYDDLVPSRRTPLCGQKKL